MKKMKYILFICFISFLGIDSAMAAEYTTGCGILGPKMVGILSWFVKVIRLGVPVLVIILGMIDFLRILFSGEDKVYKDAFVKFVKRLIIGVVIIFVPYIIQLAVKLSGIESQYGIDDFYCGIIEGSGATGTGPTEADKRDPSEYTDENDCKSAGYIYNSVSGKCVVGTGNTISASDCAASGYKVVSDSLAPGGFRCVINH